MWSVMSLQKKFIVRISGVLIADETLKGKGTVYFSPKEEWSFSEAKCNQSVILKFKIYVKDALIL